MDYVVKFKRHKNVKNSSSKTRTSFLDTFKYGLWKEFRRLYNLLFYRFLLMMEIFYLFILFLLDYQEKGS